MKSPKSCFSLGRNFVFVVVWALFFTQLTIAEDLSLKFDLNIEKMSFIKTTSLYSRNSREFAGELAARRALEKNDVRISKDKSVKNDLVKFQTLEEIYRVRTIEYFNHYLAVYTSSTDQADVTFRLLQLEFEDASLKYLKLSQVYEKAFNDYYSGKIKSPPLEPKADYSKVIKAAKKILQESPNYIHKDLVLYLYAFAHSEEGNEKETIKLFIQIIEEFPNSALIPEIVTRVGEHYFDLNDYKTSNLYYQKIKEFPNSSNYNKVIYKLAWGYFNLNEFHRSLDEFGVLVDLIDRLDGDQKSASALQMREEAIGYMSDIFFEIGGVDEAIRWTVQRGKRDYTRSLFSRIADNYFNTGNVEGARKSLNAILNFDPLSPQAPVIHDKIVKSFIKENNVQEAFSVRAEITKKYGSESQWRKENSKNAEALYFSDQLVEEYSISSATYYHNLAQKSGSVKDYQIAQKLYRNYLMGYPNGRFYSMAANNYADALFFSGYFEWAAIEYCRLAPAELNDETREKLSYDCVRAWLELYKEQSTLLGNEAIKPLFESNGALAAAQPLSPIELSFLESSQKYTEINPNGKNLLLVLFKAAEILYRKNHLAEAQAQLEKIYVNNPNSQVTIQAIQLLIDSFNFAKDFNNVELWGSRLLSLKQGQGKDSEGLSKLVGQAVFKKARVLEESKDYEKAIVEYERIVKDFPKAGIADKAMYNIANIFEKKGPLSQAIYHYRRLINAFSSSDLVKDSMFKLATIFEDNLSLPEAIQVYKQISQKFSEDSEIRSQALLNTALLTRASGNKKEAANFLFLYAKAKNLNSESQGALLEAMQMAAQTSNEKLFEKLIDAIENKTALNNDTKIVMAKLEYGFQLYSQLPDEREAAKIAGQVFKLYKKNKQLPAALIKIVAQSLMSYYESDWKDYEQLELRLPQRVLAKTLIQKANLQQKLEKNYAEVVKVGDPHFTLEALFRIARSYELFSESLNNVPMPKGFTPDMIAVYQDELHKQSAPLFQKGLGICNKVIAIAKVQNVFNNDVARCYSLASRMDPGKLLIPKAVDLNILIGAF